MQSKNHTSRRSSGTYRLRPFCLLLLLALSLTSSLQHVGAQSTASVLSLQTPRLGGPAVIKLQQYLAYLGYYLGDDGIDGWFGPDTDTALRTYQRDHGFSPLGRIAAADVDVELPFEPYSLVHGYVSPGRDLRLGYVSADGQYRTYYARISVQRVFDPPVEILNIVSVGSDSFDISVPADVGIVSPDGRFIALESVDYYSGAGRGPLVLLDTVSGQALQYDYAGFVDSSIDVGLRSAFYETEIRWIGDQTLALRLLIDYLGYSGHPGIDKSREEALGDLVGVEDPVDLGWFTIEMNVYEQQVRPPMIFEHRGQ